MGISRPGENVGKPRRTLNLKEVSPQRKKRREIADTPESSHGDLTITGENCVKDKRAKLLETFKLRRGFLPSLENKPTEGTLALFSKNAYGSFGRILSANPGV